MLCSSMSATDDEQPLFWSPSLETPTMHRQASFADLARAQSVDLPGFAPSPPPLSYIADDGNAQQTLLKHPRDRSRAGAGHSATFKRRRIIALGSDCEARPSFDNAFDNDVIHTTPSKPQPIRKPSAVASQSHVDHGFVSTEPFLGFTSAGGNAVKRPSAAALDKAAQNMLLLERSTGNGLSVFNGVEQPLNLSKKITVDRPAPLNLTINTDNVVLDTSLASDDTLGDLRQSLLQLPSPLPNNGAASLFTTGKGKAIPPPSAAAIQKVRHLVAAADSITPLAQDVTVLADNSSVPVLNLATSSTLFPSCSPTIEQTKIVLAETNCLSASSIPTVAPTTLSGGFISAAGSKLLEPSPAALEKARAIVMMTLQEENVSILKSPQLKSEPFPLPSTPIPVRTNISSNIITPINYNRGVVPASPALSSVARSSGVTPLSTPVRHSLTDRQNCYSTPLLTRRKLGVQTPQGQITTTEGNSARKFRKPFRTPFKTPMAAATAADRLKLMASTERSIEDSAIHGVGKGKQKSAESAMFDVTVPKDRRTMKQWLHFECDMNSPTVTSIIPSGAHTVTFPEGKGTWGVDEAHQQLIAQGAQVSQNFDLRWTINHYRWIVWKLACYMRFCSRTFRSWWCKDEVMRQLMYRYEREVIEAHRSCLKLIVERDDAPAKYMVLCVSSINSASDAPGGWTLELTDGWYSICATLDLCLQQALRKGKITLGDKLAIINATLNGSREPMHVLDTFSAKSTSTLALSGNSTRLARRYAKLGFWRIRAMPILLGAVSPEGGVISLLRLKIIRVYPVLFMETIAGAQGKVRRNISEEEREQQRHQVRIQQVIDKLQRFYSQSADGERHSFEQHIDSLGSFGDEARSRYDALQREVSELHDEMKRNVTQLVKLRVVGLNKHNDFVTATITVWRPEEAFLDTVKEGQEFIVNNLQAAGLRTEFRSRKAVLNLSTTMRTRWQPVRNSPVIDNKVDTLPQDRVITVTIERKISIVEDLAVSCAYENIDCDDFLENRSIGSELDMVFFVVDLKKLYQVQKRQTGMTQLSTDFYVADCNAELFVFKCQENIEGDANSVSPMRNMLKKGKVISALNLIVNGRDKHTQLPCALSTEATDFWSKPTIFNEAMRDLSKQLSESDLMDRASSALSKLIDECGDDDSLTDYSSHIGSRLGDDRNNGLDDLSNSRSSLIYNPAPYYFLVNDLVSGVDWGQFFYDSQGQVPNGSGVDVTLPITEAVTAMSAQKEIVGCICDVKVVVGDEPQLLTIGDLDLELSVRTGPTFTRVIVGASVYTDTFDIGETIGQCPYWNAALSGTGAAICNLHKVLRKRMASEQSNDKMSSLLSNVTLAEILETKLTFSDSLMSEALCLSRADIAFLEGLLRATLPDRKQKVSFNLI